LLRTHAVATRGDLKTQNALIELYSDVGDLAKMFDVFRNLECLQLRANTRTFNVILSALVHHNFFDLAQRVFVQFQQRKLVMDQYTWSLHATVVAEIEGSSCLGSALVFV
jgi:pentatricopeptide repeat protein